MIHIALDTEVFRRENFHFGSKRFGRWRELVERGEIAVYMTDVIVGEIRRGLTDHVRSAVEALRQKDLRRTIGILAQSSIAGLSGVTRSHDVGELTSELLALFDQLLKNLHVQIISTNEVSVEQLRSRYFDAVAPFGRRLEKKHEFPDALSVLALEDWAHLRHATLRVVSADEGIIEAAKGSPVLTSEPNLQGVISAVLSKLERTAAVASAAERVPHELREQIEGRIAVDFLDGNFYVEDDDGEVSDVTVDEVDMLDWYLAVVDPDVVTFEFEAAIRFHATMTFPDPDQTAYDSESGETYVFGHITQLVSRREILTGGMNVHIDTAEISKSEIRQLWLDQSDVGVRPGE